MNPETTYPTAIDLNQKCSVVIEANRDLVELQRIVVTYNDNMNGTDYVEIEVYEDDEEKLVTARLIGTAMGLFQIGILYGEATERKYIKSLGTNLRDLVLQK